MHLFESSELLDNRGQKRLSPAIHKRKYGPTNSEWSSPTYFIPKIDSRKRLVTDYRRVAGL